MAKSCRTSREGEVFGVKHHLWTQIFVHLMHQVGSGLPKYNFLFLQQLSSSDISPKKPWILSCWPHNHHVLEKGAPLAVLGYLCPEFHEGANPKPDSRGGEGEATAAAQMSLPALNTELHKLQTAFPTPPTELWMCLGGVREGRLKFFFHSAISPLGAAQAFSGGIFPFALAPSVHYSIYPAENSTITFLPINKP